MPDRSILPQRCCVPLTVLLLPVLLCGCNVAPGDGDGAATPAVVADKALPQDLAAQRSPGKPQAPVDIRYRVLGTPLVGQPVAIELDLVSSLQGSQMRMSYSINDAASLAFAGEQPRAVEFRVAANEQGNARQVTVVPQREGRLYLNVTVEVDTDSGTMLKSMSIPLSVGYAEVEPTVNGELVETADGETVLSMPADEN